MRNRNPLVIAIAALVIALAGWLGFDLAALQGDPPRGAPTQTASGLPPPPEVDWTDPSVSEAMRRFYLDSKRLSNARAKAELGWRPEYPSYREGIEALIAAGF